ncbi:hypothetical protein [Bordetella genomosp. 13]|uniref:Glycine zipper domain-containing protein n=1 Tax=Bordetella genomosp. 13 TaxID=463040 RepID=A0A1W6Z984_9BORD|nr:hypothetical protein [Bordetella genomosp. 13]ARP93911.1 hypothetical protein CAL15_05625 [Bordetella genomosp. 13]
MSLIVAARFDTFPEAENAARKLFARQFSEDSVNIFFVNPPGWHDQHPAGGDRTADPDARGASTGAFLGAGLMAMLGAAIGAGILFALGSTGFGLVVAAALGAYVGSLMGAMRMAGRRSERNPNREDIRVRHAGVLTAVHVSPEQEEQAAQVLRESGGKDVERANGRWRDGKWVDFDPVQPPHPQ